MSLRYQLLGIPANIDEVVDRAQRTHEMPEVYPTRGVVNGFTAVNPVAPECSNGAQKVQYRIKVRIGRTKITAAQWEKWFNGFVFGIDNHRSDFVAEDRFARERAEDLAAELSRKGIPVLYNDEIYCSPVNSEPADCV